MNFKEGLKQNNSFKDLTDVPPNRVAQHNTKAEEEGKIYRVPYGTKEINSKAFSHNYKLEEIVLPEGLEKIHKDAFSLLRIKRITIPASVKEISESAFSFCQNLQNVTLLCNIDILPDNVFKYCTGCFSKKEYIKITAPGQNLPFEKAMSLQDMSVADIQRKITLPEKDFWSDNEFVLLTKKCAKGDTSAMIELGNYFKKQDCGDFCIYASSFWYYCAYLYGNKDAADWYKKWFIQNPEKRIPIPILPNKIYKTFEKTVHDEYSCYKGAVLKALGFGFFSEKRTYEVYHFYESGLVQMCSQCNTYGPDADGFGMSEEYDWWFLDEFFNELPGVEMLHSYSFHERSYAFTETFNEQYETAKRAIEKRMFFNKKETDE